MTPYHEMEARRLQAAFKDGDALAPFECCAIWSDEGLPTSTLPTWVVEYMVKKAAEYFRQGRAIGAKDLKAKKTRPPSFDALLGLTGGRGRPGAWRKRAEEARDPFVQAYLDRVKELRDDDGRYVPLIVEQGKDKGAFRDEALDLIARRFKIRGQDGKSRAKTMRRRYHLKQSDK